MPANGDRRTDKLPRPPRPGVPWPAADATYVDGGRGAVKLFALGALLCLPLAAVGLAAALAPEGSTWAVEDGSRGIAGGIGGGFAGVCLLLLLGTVIVLLRPSGIAVDGSGIWYLYHRKAALIPWPQLRAVGGSYSMPPTTSTSPGGQIGTALANKATSVKGRRFAAVEIFLLDNDSVATTGPLHVAWRDGPDEISPAPGLDGGRLRIIVAGNGYQRIASLLQERVGDLWFGEYQRNSVA